MGLPDFRIVDLIDIVLFAFLVYYIYRLVKGTAAINIFIGIIIFLVIYQITVTLEMKLLGLTLGAFVGAGFIALVVVFQQEIRRFLLMIGTTNFTSRKKLLRQLKFFREDSTAQHHVVDEIVSACFTLSKTKTGALIAIKRDVSMDFAKNTGDNMDILVNAPILRSIFYKNSPLHDGAVIVEDNKITATRAILPVSNSKQIPSRFGLRHRAALGITERTNAIAVIVSEETGQVSLAHEEELETFQDENKLAEKMKTLLS
ncbi:membrane protein [Nonlabens sp. MIC269]|nr:MULTISPECIES: diadenylate cyclase CdaA [Nonlabens]ALM21510.1 membrane protein [Nonlabens sp. MIC269]ARN71767.1 TIGR00159 family protein [Nonlabens tegetincola]MEE2802696.1 diadenylate cyclase CdaA [Bacteroidota bacterium]PQJ14273.1 TIGR00159 family protein [Nonlabens tegetincola]